MPNAHSSIPKLRIFPKHTQPVQSGTPKVASSFAHTIGWTEPEPRLAWHSHLSETAKSASVRAARERSGSNSLHTITIPVLNNSKSTNNPSHRTRDGGG